jgi:RHS repeat-associated protein
LPTQHAYLTGSASEKVYTPLASGKTRTTQKDYTHDSLGRVAKTSDLGDTSITTDDLCTTTSYADNTSKWILNAADETTTVAVACSGTPSLPGDAVSDTRTFYDGSTTFAAAPTVGDATMTQKAASYSGTTPTFVTLSTATLDQYGRTTASTDADNHKTATAYTPATGAQPTSMTVTDPMALVTTTTLDPLRALTLSVTDPGGYITTQRYDALGRRTAVYQPGHNAANSSALPNLKYTYTVSATAPSTVNTYTLNEDSTFTYRLSETLYDALLRARETQTETTDGARNIADTIYNTDGVVSESTEPYFNTGAVSATYVQAQAGQVPSATGYSYDSAGRKTAQIAYALGTETWRTTYNHGGNFTTTIPPKGAPASTTFTDGRGRTSDLYQYHTGVTPDPLTAARTDYTDTRYTYYPNDLKATAVDDAGNTWAWQYNLLGQQTQAKDPDAGTSASTYDNAGQLLTATDARGKQTTTTYDADGRKTATYDTSTTSTLSSTNKLAAWTFDTVKKGYPTASISYSGGDTYTSTVLGYNLYAKTSAVRTTVTGESTALIPAAGLVTSYGYTATGRLNGQLDPAGGGLNSEDVSYGASKFGQPTSLVSPVGSYVQAVGYSEAGQPLQYTMITDTANLYRTLTYDPQTQALTSSQATGSAGVLDRTTYGYTNTAVSTGAGLLVSSTDQQNLGASTDTQCFQYDYAARLSQAWTATDACAATPSASAAGTVGGPVAPYWQSWTYDSAGDRATQTDHATSGVAANDTTSTYHYPAAGSTQAHTLTSTSAAGPAAVAHTGGYEYDAAGNLTKVTGGSTGDQVLTWNTQGKLATLTSAAGASSYVYDADGNLVIRRDPGSVTFFYGDQEYVLDTASGTVAGTRSYRLNGELIAQRSSAGLVQFVFADRLGTGGLAVSGKDQSLIRRQYLPFGGVRGSPAPSWLGGKGYLGAPADAVTSYTDLGAREYDPQLGRFLSVDPVLELDDPTQLGGYDYAGNDPVTKSDPSGLRLDPGYGGPGEPAHPQTPAQHKSRHPGGSQPGNGGHHDVGPALHTDSTPQSRFLDYVDTLNNAYTIPKPPVRHSHWWSDPMLMNAAIVGVGICDVAQLGLDPVTDGAEAALLAARAAVATTAAATESEGKTTSLFRASPKGQSVGDHANGYDPARFPGGGHGYPDGRAYFGVNDSSIAQEYARTQGYDSNIIETRIPNDVFESTFKEHVSLYDGGPRMQIGIPRDLIPDLNRYPRFWVNP